MPIYICCIIISAFFYPELKFIILMSFILLIAIIASIIFRIKWSALTGFLSQATQLLTLELCFNFISFAILKYEKLQYNYSLIYIILCVVSLIISIPIVYLLYKRLDYNKKPKYNTAAVAGAAGGASAAFTSSLIMIISPEGSTLAILINILMNILTPLLIFGMVLAFHRAWLIKKYKLKIDLNNIK